MASCLSQSTLATGLGTGPKDLKLTTSTGAVGKPTPRPVVPGSLWHNK